MGSPACHRAVMICLLSHMLLFQYQVEHIMCLQLAMQEEMGELVGSVIVKITPLSLSNHPYCPHLSIPQFLLLMLLPLLPTPLLHLLCCSLILCLSYHQRLPFPPGQEADACVCAPQIPTVNVANVQQAVHTYPLSLSLMLPISPLHKLMSPLPSSLHFKPSGK
jgi:hypothetical protein